MPPTAPSNLTAVASGPTRVNLNWTASTDNVGVAGYQVVRNGSQIATSIITSYSDTTVAAGTTYNYIVRAYDAAGNVSPDSNTASVTTPTVSPAPVLDKTVTTKQASGSSSISSPSISTAQPNELLVAFIASDGPATGGSQRITAVTGGGLTWTLRSRANAQAGTAEIWTAPATNVVTNVIVTATRANWFVSRDDDRCRLPGGQLDREWCCCERQCSQWSANGLPDDNSGEFTGLGCRR